MLRTNLIYKLYIKNAGHFPKLIYVIKLLYKIRNSNIKNALLKKKILNDYLHCSNNIKYEKTSLQKSLIIIFIYLFLIYCKQPYKYYYFLGNKEQEFRMRYYSLKYIGSYLYIQKIFSSFKFYYNKMILKKFSVIGIVNYIHKLYGLTYKISLYALRIIRILNTTIY
uniref:Uncharacterized protein n=1 Tax=Amorphochlora amoebiformis TaxID=1561963 RepID=A0A0H5BIJ4_9EUKA|nr:hypothetical protein [Amorphochlora amoebiformis]